MLLGFIYITSASPGGNLLQLKKYHNYFNPCGERRPDRNSVQKNTKAGSASPFRPPGSRRMDNKEAPADFSLLHDALTSRRGKAGGNQTVDLCTSTTRESTRFSLLSYLDDYIGSQGAKVSLW